MDVRDSIRVERVRGTFNFYPSCAFLFYYFVLIVVVNKIKYSFQVFTRYLGFKLFYFLSNCSGYFVFNQSLFTF